MTNTSSIAVVIPAHNAASYLGEAIESIINQSLPPAEICVIDDGSTDETASIAQQYTGKITLLSHSTPQGASAARNAGILATKSPFIAFHDADDVSLPDRLAIQHHQLAQNASAAMTFSSMEYIDHTGNTSGDIVLACDYEGFLGKMLVRNRVGSTSVVMARRDALLDVGGFDSSLSHNEEYALWLSLASQSPVLSNNTSLVYYRLHSGNISHNWKKQQQNETLILNRYSIGKIHKALATAYPVEPDYSIALARVMIRRSQFDTAEQVLTKLLTNHKDSRINFFLGNLKLIGNNIVKAEYYFEQCLSIMPDMAPALNNLGVIKAWKNDYQNAAHCFEQALLNKRHYTDAEHNLSLLTAKRCDPDITNNLRITWTLLRKVLKPNMPVSN